MTDNDIPDFLRIEIRHRDGIEVFDPNSFIHFMFSEPQKLDGWESTGDRSVISGKPALVYKTHQVEVALSKDEIHRLAMLSLTSKEFHTLQSKVGIFHEIHDDFYDPETGEALQPRIED